MALRPTDFKSVASTRSATGAVHGIDYSRSRMIAQIEADFT